MGCLSAWSGLGFGIGMFLAAAPGRPWWQRLVGLGLVWAFFFFIGYFWVVGAVAQSVQYSSDPGATQQIDEISAAAIRFFSQVALWAEGLAALAAVGLALFSKSRHAVRPALPGLALLFTLPAGFPLMTALAGILTYSQYLAGSPAFAGVVPELLAWLGVATLGLAAGFGLSVLTGPKVQ